MNKHHEPTLNEALHDAHEDRVETLAEYWHEQLLSKGYVSDGGPFNNRMIHESDFIDWAEADGVYVPNPRDDLLPLLMYHARGYLEGRLEWD